MLARHACVLPSQHIWLECAACYAGETQPCPPYPAQMCVKRFALCWQDTFIRDHSVLSASSRTSVRKAHRAMLARHVRVRPAPQLYAGSAAHYVGETRTCPPSPAHIIVCSGRTQRYAGATRKCSAPPCTYEHDALRAMQTRHARVSPSQPPVLEAIGSMRMQHARTCFPRTAHMCGKRSALRWRDAYVSAQLRKYMQEARRAM